MVIGDPPGWSIGIGGIAAWYVWQLVREGQVGQPPSRRRDRSLFVVEVREQVFLELLERVCNGTTCCLAVVLR